jgi:hypothetical protein
MKVSILVLIAALALPIMASGQGEEKQAQQGQEQTKEPATETQTTAPAKGKQPAHTQTAPATKAETNGTIQQNRAEDANRKDAAAGAERSQTNRSSVKTENKTNTKVNVQEFRERHQDVFSLGQHPKEFFVQKYGENHFRLIGNIYFVYVDGCWVSVHVNGFGYSERVLCSGDPDFIEVY